MSRKFLDDNVQVLKFVEPSAATTAYDTDYPPGHTLLNAGDGTLYTNQGDALASVWGNWPANRYELEERFLQAPLANADIAVNANLNFEVLGTNSTSALCTFADGGGVTLTTAGATNDQEILTPHLDTKQSAWAAAKWNTNDRVVFETTIKTGSAITAATIWAGLKLTNTQVVATDDDQVFVRYAAGTASGVWQLITSNAGTDTTTNTTVTVAASTSYHIKIKVGADLYARLYINGVLAATSTAKLKANIDLIPYVGVHTITGAAARAITVRGIKLSKDLND